MKSIWLSLFITTAVVVIIAIVLEMPGLYRLAKPLLIITLLFYFLSASSGYPRWRVFAALALIFSWFGDVLLLLENQFIAGLAAFLVAHIFYIVVYWKTGAAQGRIRPLLLAAVVIAGIASILVIYPGLGHLLIPVVVYSTVLLTMVVLALKRQAASTRSSYLLVAIGALLFVVSDSLLGIGKFAVEIPANHLLVMSTYIAAQFMIVHGLLKHEEVIRE